MPISIDMWYHQDIREIDKIDISCYPDGSYRGNVYIKGKCVGDYHTFDSVALERTFNWLTFNW